MLPEEVPSEVARHVAHLKAIGTRGSVTETDVHLILSRIVAFRNLREALPPVGQRCLIGALRMLSMADEARRVAVGCGVVLADLADADEAGRAGVRFYETPGASMDLTLANDAPVHYLAQSEAAWRAGLSESHVRLPLPRAVALSPDVPVALCARHHRLSGQRGGDGLCCLL